MKKLFQSLLLVALFGAAFFVPANSADALATVTVTLDAASPLPASVGYGLTGVNFTIFKITTADQSVALNQVTVKGYATYNYRWEGSDTSIKNIQICAQVTGGRECYWTMNQLITDSGSIHTASAQTAWTGGPIIPANSSRTFYLYGDIGAAAAGQFSLGLSSIGYSSQDNLGLYNVTNNKTVDVMGNNQTVVGLSGGAVRLTAPNGGESLVMGSNSRITWTDSNTSSNDRYTLFLVQNNGSNGSALGVIAVDVNNQLWYDWTVGQVTDASGSILPGSGYYIQVVKQYTDQLGFDDNDSPFLIISATGTITITNPTSETTWTRGQAHTVFWQSTAGLGSGKIRLSSCCADLSNLASGLLDVAPVTLGAGSYSFAIPATFPLGAAKLYVMTADENIYGAVYYVFITDNNAVITYQTISGPSTAVVNALPQYQFTAGSTAFDSGLNYKINWGDNQVDQAYIANNNSANPFNDSHTWTAAGTYTITFTACSPSLPNVCGTKTQTVTVSNSLAPKVDLKVNGYTSTGYQEPTVNIGSTSTVTITWSASNATSCNTYGQTLLRLTDGTNWKLDNLPVSGTRTFAVAGQKDAQNKDMTYATIGIQCWSGASPAVSDSKGLIVTWSSASQNLNISTPSPLSNAKTGVSYYNLFNAPVVENLGSYNWSLASGAMPAGLRLLTLNYPGDANSSLKNSTALITGTPTAAGTYVFTVQVIAYNTTTSSNITASKQFTLTVEGSASANTKPIGWLDGISKGGVISGWVIDQDHPNTPIEVHVYFDITDRTDSHPTVVTTSVERNDVNAVFGASGTHGFSFRIPDNLRDGKRHTVNIFGIDTDDSSGLANAALYGSPKTFTIKYDSANRHARGTVVIGENGTVYFLGAEIRYPFPSPEVFFSWGHQFAALVLANPADLALPIGPTVQTKQ
ncbi:MAG: hypothetical protein A3H14_02090 [Candidatus Doudnabacteria bacterium RIFCSPLOWO2_12_FULL_49_8]|nr:MAG: hypothetical protein A3H14_02090 [Candidatus Doudnabacteria bacterium RIFCSPLOWO2_12_FULL_49_8]